MSQKKVTPGEIEEATIEVTISTPDALIWKGEAKAVSAVNSEGAFDVLGKHANFITIVENSPIIVRSIDGEKEYSFKQAIVYNHDNVIKIYGNL